MLYTPKIQSAIRFAIKVHESDQKQKRKGKDVPYIVHPLTVGLILATAGASEDVIVAGILHDTIEDSIKEKKVGEKMLTERFGENVYKLVRSVTEEDKIISWDERKADALEHIKTFSNDSVFLKSADLISNTREIIDDFKKGGNEMFKKFAAPKEKVLKVYINAMEAILKKWPKNPLASDLKDILKIIKTI